MLREQFGLFVSDANSRDHFVAVVEGGTDPDQDLELIRAERLTFLNSTHAQ